MGGVSLQFDTPPWIKMEFISYMNEKEIKIGKG